MDEIKIITLDTIDSTNNYLKLHPGLRDDFTVVRAVNQTLGRGRLSRSWHSAPGLDLAFSFIFSPEPAVKNIGAFSLACGMALRRVIGPVIDADLDLRWPNDLYCRSRKIAGILCEAVFEEKTRIITGIGVNVNSRSFPDEIAGSATSLALESGREHDITGLMLLIIGECRLMFSALEFPLRPGLIDEWKSSCSSIGKQAVYNRDGRQASGTVRSIDGNGFLIVTDHETGFDVTIMDEAIIEDR